MQANKKNNNGWILCPSKSFPGKLYYFNVINGEAAWSLNDVEKKSLKQGCTIQKIADKSHNFPEPITPPQDDFTTNISHQPAPNYLANMEQRFGVPVLSQYFPSVAPVLWAPIQMIMPEAKRMTSQVTQTLKPDSVLNHSTDVLLNKRFSKPIFSNENIFQNRIVSNKFCDNSMTNKIMTNQVNIKSVSNQTETSNLFKCPVIQTLKRTKQRSISESDVSTEVLFPFKNVKLKSTLNIPNRVNFNQSSLSESPFWPDTLTQSNKAKNLENKIFTDTDSSNIDNQKSILKICGEVNNSNGIEYNNLDSDDLRFLLVAKRRKSLDCVDIREGKKTKSDSVSNITPNTKKKVTFDLVSLEDGGSEDCEPKYIEQVVDVQNPSIEQLRNLATPSMVKDVWYIVVDTEILLDNYTFIDQYVQSDVRCKLLIPDVVKSDIETLSKGVCCGRHRIIVARQLCRRLAMPEDHVVLQSSDIGEDNQLVTNSILNCCIVIMRAKNRHVVLIANDPVLLKKAKTLGIHGYKLQDIKDGVVPKRKITFDIESNKIQVNDEGQDSENLFLQNTIENTDTNNIFNNGFDSTKDIVDDDRLINLTKPKNIIRTNVESTINYESDGIDCTSEIGRNIKGINIQDKVIKKSLFDNENQFEILNFNNASKSEKFKYIEEDIKKYYVKNKLMEDKIRLRIDEWICYFSQIMEDVLTVVLLQKSSHYDLPPPWYLCEVVECIKRMYVQEPSIVSIVDKLSLTLFNCSCDKGKLKRSINAKDFMKILGYGITLIHTLQEITPLEELKEAKNKLDAMLRTIEDPTEERDIEYGTPAVSRIEDTDMLRTERYNFIKDRADIIKYLKKNFTQWKSHNEDADIHYYDKNHQHEDRKIVRTFGKNVGLLKIDHCKNVSMTAPSEPHGLVVDTNKKTDVQKVVRIVNNDMCNTKGKNVDSTKIHNTIDIAMPKLRRTFQTKDETINGPKVIKNFGNMDRFSLEKTENQSNMLNNNKVDFRSDINVFGNDLNITKHGNTFEVAEENKDGPKVIRPFQNINTSSSKISGNQYQENDIQFGIIKRVLKNEPKVVINMKLINAFEEKFKNKAKELNMEDLDYEVEDSECSTMKVTNISQNINNYDDDQMNNEANNNVYYPTSPQIHNTKNKYLPNNKNLTNDTLVSKTISNATANENNDNSDTTVTSEFVNNVVTKNNDTSDDSGFENESLQAYSLAKSFLTEVSRSLKIIYMFIDKSINAVRDEELQEDKIKILHNKANETHLHIAQVIEKLKRIIERESNEGITLKSFLIKAGDISGDKRMSRYRQVVKKSLEQAQLLENALKLMLNIIDNNFADHPLFITDNCNNLKYYNIFE